MFDETSWQKFCDQIAGGFLGLAIGDALGVPVETMSHEEILAATNGAGITDYIAPLQTRINDTARQLPGSTSDDTQLARATGRSLVRCKKFDIIDQGLTLAEEFERGIYGMGRTTRDAATAIKLWRDSSHKEGRHPAIRVAKPEKDGESAGSGPAMKIFPLAAYDLIGQSAFDAEIIFCNNAMTLGRMTHGDIRASIASVALGNAIALFADAPTLLVNAARVHIAETLMERVRRAEYAFQYSNPRTPPFSEYLAHAFTLLDDPVALRTEVNASFRAVHSVSFAIATAFRHPDNFRAGVLEAVNAGKDTDTTGSMVGAILGARYGFMSIPTELIRGCRDTIAVLSDATALCEMIKGVRYAT